MLHSIVLVSFRKVSNFPHFQRIYYRPLCHSNVLHSAHKTNTNTCYSVTPSNYQSCRAFLCTRVLPPAQTYSCSSPSWLAWAFCRHILLWNWKAPAIKQLLVSNHSASEMYQKFTYTVTNYAQNTTNVYLFGLSKNITQNLPCNSITDFLKTTNSWCTAPPHFQFCRTHNQQNDKSGSNPQWRHPKLSTYRSQPRQNNVAYKLTCSW